MGAADVGQATIIQDGLVLGVEALEGTDALLARCAALRRGGPGGVLVKLRKPGQERRADLPTSGVATEIGRAAGRERGRQFVYISVIAPSLKNNKTKRLNSTRQQNTTKPTK